MQHQPPYFLVALLGMTLALGAAAACSGDADSTATNETPGSTGGMSGKGGAGGKGGSSTGGSGGGDAGSGGASAAGGAGGTINVGSGNGGGGAGGAGGSAPTCQPMCSSPQICSKAGTCIDPGTCAVNDDCEGGKVCDAGSKTCVPGGGCGATKLVADQIPPNFLLVLDRSCSMTAKTGDKTKWQVAVAAINKLTTDYKDKIRFGLAMFPDLTPNNCTQEGAPVVPVGDDTEATIQNILTKSLNTANKYFPSNPCVTNIDTAMLQASQEVAFTEKDRKHFVMLISDGKQSGSCGGNTKDPDTEKYIADMYAKGIGTFVVGFGAATDFAQMDKFAVAGGHPNPDPARDYYLAENEQALYAAFESIAKQTLGCDFALKETPPDASSIYVFFDENDQVLKDTSHKDGWDYDAASNTVSFHGPACDALKDGKVQKLDIVFGCPGGGDTIGVPPDCQSGIGCDALHLCPNDPQKGAGYCSDGCCKFQKID